MKGARHRPPCEVAGGWGCRLAVEEAEVRELCTRDAHGLQAPPPPGPTAHSIPSVLPPVPDRSGSPGLQELCQCHWSAGQVFMEVRRASFLLSLWELTP